MAPRRTDTGVMQLIGPAPVAQDRTCVSGRTCAANGLEGTFGAPGRILVLDSCGLGGAVPRTSGDGRSAPTLPTVEPVVLGAGPWSSAGGVYRLCWCGLGPCALPTDFAVDAGALTVLGPRPLDQDRTCVAGAACRLDDISAQGPLAGSVLLASSTCGMDGAVVPRLPAAGASDAGTWNFGWGNGVALTAAGGAYRLCWCAAAGNASLACGVAAEFRVDLGAFYIVGPSPLSQAGPCVFPLPRIPGMVSTARHEYAQGFVDSLGQTTGTSGARTNIGRSLHSGNAVWERIRGMQHGHAPGNTHTWWTRLWGPRESHTPCGGREAGRPQWRSTR